MNIINNYYKPGPATQENVKNRIIQPSQPLGKYYVEGNYVEGDAAVNENNWNGGVHSDKKEVIYQEEAFPAAPVTTHNPREVLDLVLAYGGASYRRDAADERIVRETRTGTATYKGSKTGLPGIIDSQKDVGGWPKLNKGEKKTDSDRDGMPDSWEEEYQLNPDDPDDATGRDLSNYYDNIEVYLNSIVEDITRSQRGETGYFPEPTEMVEQAYDFVVDAAGSGDFTTVQEAIDAVPDLRKNETRILKKNGVYKEKLVLPESKTNVTFIGEDVNNTIITYDNFSSRHNRFGEEIGTSGSSGFFVYGDSFTAKNITFENSAGPLGQAVAVRIDGDRVMFEICKFLGFQDTMYPHGRDSRQYYKNCYIEGTTDFIFGWSTAVFEDCEIYSKEGGHYITAASTEKDSSVNLPGMHLKEVCI